MTRTTKIHRMNKIYRQAKIKLKTMVLKRSRRKRALAMEMTNHQTQSGWKAKSMNQGKKSLKWLRSFWTLLRTFWTLSIGKYLIHCWKTFMNLAYCRLLRMGSEPVHCCKFQSTLRNSKSFSRSSRHSVSTRDWCQCWCRSAITTNLDRLSRLSHCWNPWKR